MQNWNDLMADNFNIVAPEWSEFLPKFILFVAVNGKRQSDKTQRWMYFMIL
jgi:hypothetical protein